MNLEIARQDDLNALCGGIGRASGASLAGGRKGNSLSVLRLALDAVGRWGSKTLRTLTGGMPAVVGTGAGWVSGPVHLMAMPLWPAVRQAVRGTGTGGACGFARRLPGIGTAMRLVELRFALAVMIGACCGLPGAASALDADASGQQPAPAGVSGSSTPAEAFRAGTKAYFAGDKAAAADAFGTAADMGHPVAQWKLGRMYQEGDGVTEDDYRAFELFSEVANAHADDAPASAQAPFVANAFVELGSYYLSGIKNTVTPNVERARELYTYAASYFGDADAQYRLGQLYLTGAPASDDNEPPAAALAMTAPVKTASAASAPARALAAAAEASENRDPRLAARWLKLAAEKGHPQAQALLGKMLVDGSDIRRNMVAGLMWLTVASSSMQDSENNDWIRMAQEDAFSVATLKERVRATELARAWLAANPPRE